MFSPHTDNLPRYGWQSIVTTASVSVCMCLSASISLELPLCFFTRRMPYLPPNQQRQSTEGNFANRKCYNLIFSPFGGKYDSYLFYWTVLDTGRLSQIMWYKFSPTSHPLYGRAFQFRQKSFHSIRFDSRYRIDFFDSIRQSDKFAACTLIFKQLS